jgi:methylmalonyl-CoA mutase C-terminal domain/subunit
MAKGRKIRALMAMPPLENHTRGFFTVAGMLKDAGMEVILLGNELPERIIEAAIQEDAQVVGISLYCGSPVVFGEKMLTAAKQKGIKDKIVFVLGGIFPPQDEPKLKEIGFSEIFPPGPRSTREKIVSGIENAVRTKIKS